MAKATFSSPLLTQIVELSFSLAINLEQTTITTEHILFAVLQISAIRRYFTSQGIDAGLLSKDIIEYIKTNSKFLKNQLPTVDPQIMTGQLTAEVTQYLENIFNFAKSEKRDVDIADVLLGLLYLRDTYASYFMTKYGITEDMILELKNGIPLGKSTGNNLSNISAGALDEHCINVNEKVKNSPSDPLIGREKEIFTIAHTLSKRKKCNALLVGDPGVGKTMIVEGLAQKINDGIVPLTLKDKIIYSIDIGSLVAGSKYRGDYEEKIKDILAEVANRPEVILYIDEAEKMDAGEGKGQMGLGLTSMLKPYLSRGQIKILASTTWEGYRNTFEKDTALMRRFRIVTVPEPTAAETVLILNGCRKSTEEFHNVTIEDSAINTAVELTIKYQPEKRLPDKAIDIIDSACARTKVIEGESTIINRASIIREITETTGIKVKTETNDENDAKKILDLASRLKTIVFHQDSAVDIVSKSLIVSQAGLKDPKKPIGSYLFVGPSGVGKTMLAQEIAADLNMGFIRFDMSGFMEKHSISRLIGSPPGYVGFGDGSTGEGELVNELIKCPNSVVLFDEVEKAHPEVFNICLQLLDNGEIKGTTGKTASSKNCIIIMTSNLGTGEANKDQLGFNKEKTGKSESSKAIDKFFLTELRGRLTAIVDFKNLDDISYRRIVVERINDIANLVPARNLKIIATEQLITHILELNNSKQFGAREIAKIVKDIISYPLGIRLLEGKIENGSTITLDWKDEKLDINASLATVPIEDAIEK